VQCVRLCMGCIRRRIPLQLSTFNALLRTCATAGTAALRHLLHTTTRLANPYPKP